MLNCDDGRFVDTSLHYENQLEFATRDEAKKWVVQKGKEKKCKIVSGNQTNPKRFEMVCTRSRRYECPFKTVFNKTKGENGVWKMKVANGCHNHEDLESLVRHPADAKFKPEKFAQLPSQSALKKPRTSCRSQTGDHTCNLSDVSFLGTASGEPNNLFEIPMEPMQKQQQSALLPSNTSTRNIVTSTHQLHSNAVAVGVQAHYSRRPTSTPSQQPSHFYSSGPSGTTQPIQNPVNVPETLNHSQMKSSPSGHQVIGMMGRIGVGSQMQPVSSSMRSPTPACSQSLSRLSLVSPRICEEKKSQADGPSEDKNTSTDNLEMDGSEKVGNLTASNDEEKVAEEIDNESLGVNFDGFSMNESECGNILDDSDDAVNKLDYKAKVAAENIDSDSDKRSKWESEDDMLSSLEEDPVLCMEAVCALQRQQMTKGRSISGCFSKFLPVLRGSEIAEFLTDNNPKGDLKKSVKELEMFMPGGLEDCKTLARFFSNQLFTIYQNHEDPFYGRY